ATRAVHVARVTSVRAAATGRTRLRVALRRRARPVGARLVGRAVLTLAATDAARLVRRRRHAVRAAAASRRTRERIAARGRRAHVAAARRGALIAGGRAVAARSAGRAARCRVQTGHVALAVRQTAPWTVRGAARRRPDAHAAARDWRASLPTRRAV